MMCEASRSVARGYHLIQTNILILHEVADRFDVEFFRNDVSLLSGVQMEDGSGSGTAGWHWEGRTYFMKLMTEIIIRHLWISLLQNGKHTAERVQ
jgi:hypothetical protein